MAWAMRKRSSEVMLSRWMVVDVLRVVSRMRRKTELQSQRYCHHAISRSEGRNAVSSRTSAHLYELLDDM